MKKFIAIGALVGALAALPALASSNLKGEAKDSWIQGKIETVYLLNTHLNGFAIDTDVSNGAVHLTGKVESSIDKDLAGELAKGVEGVSRVDNDLVVDTKARSAVKQDARSFSGWVGDVTTTAEVKSKLIANSNTHGLKIDVDTKDDVVTLSGTVASPEEMQLAEQIARNAGGVKSVHNKLTVR
jgi:osmotically-inducible protein OsmY